MNIERRYKPVYLAPKDRHSQMVDVRQINVAFEYLLTTEKKKKTNPYICIGSGEQTRVFIKRVKLPAIPLLRDNKVLRNSLKPREQSPLFKVVAGAIAFKFQNIREEVRAALKTERQNYPILYRLEPPLEGERTNFPLTLKEYAGIIEE